MKQLTVFEMEEISGGYSWDFSSFQSSVTSILSNGAEAIASAVLGSLVAAAWGTLIGGTQSGSNGGLLGFGLIGNAIGMVWGAIAGALSGAAGGAALGWDATVALVKQSYESALNGTFVPWG